MIAGHDHQRIRILFLKIKRDLNRLIKRPKVAHQSSSVVSMPSSIGIFIFNEKKKTFFNRTWGVCLGQHF